MPKKNKARKDKSTGRPTAVPLFDPPGIMSLSPKLNVSRLPSPRQEISYLGGSLTISNDFFPVDDHSDDILEAKNEYSDSEEFMNTEIQHFAAETDSILSVLCTTDKESTNAQLCLGNLRNMQANLAHIIPQYVDDESILCELLDLKERIDDTLDQYAPISEEARHALMQRSMSDIMSDLTQKDEESEASDTGSEVSLCVICFEDRSLEVLPCGHSFCKQCIQQHLQVSLTEGKVLNLDCLSSACDFQFTEPVLEQFLTEKQFNRYQQFLLAATIRADPNKKCCPLPDCNGILPRNQGFESQKEWESHPYTKCESCQKELCFECVRKFHPKQTCKEYEHSLRLKQLLTDEEDMKKWQSENNAKPCPRCKVLIIKSEGCNHMRCRTCGENFCWICLTRGATEGHFNLPGKCFGQLFTEDEITSSERALNVASYVLFLPILGPAFGLTSAIEGIQLQSKKMNRHLEGVDYTIVVTGSNKADRSSLLRTYCGSEPKIEGKLLVFHRTVSVRLVKCRLRIVDVSHELLSEEEIREELASADGFVILFRPSMFSGLDDSVLIYDDLCKIFSRPAVPGALFSVVKKGARNRKTEIPKKISKKKARELSLSFKQVEASKRWGLSQGFTTLLKAMLKRWEPTIDSIIDD